MEVLLLTGAFSRADPLNAFFAMVGMSGDLS